MKFILIVIAFILAGCASQPTSFYRTLSSDVVKEFEALGQVNDRIRTEHKKQNKIILDKYPLSKSVINADDYRGQYKVVPFHIQESVVPDNIVNTFSYVWSGVEFTISQDGIPENVTLMRESRIEELDKIAVKAVSESLYNPVVFEGEVISLKNYRRKVHFKGRLE